MTHFQNGVSVLGRILERGINFFLERGANLESRAAHTHPKNTQVPPPGPPPKPGKIKAPWGRGCVRQHLLKSNYFIDFIFDTKISVPEQSIHCQMIFNILIKEKLLGYVPDFYTTRMVRKFNQFGFTTIQNIFIIRGTKIYDVFIHAHRHDI